jgi:putative hydrolase of HD superfamily
MEPMTPSDRFSKQIQFIIEVDKLKQIYRQTFLADGSRRENSAEHSWHLALMALLLEEYAADSPIDISKVVRMVLIHDLVEIDAGDTFCYDEAANGNKPQREKQAANRIFGLLPVDQGEALHSLWQEFECGDTVEARFARALDRTQPVLHNYLTNGAAWQAHGVRSAQVIERNQHIEQGSSRLWRYIRGIIDEAIDCGYLEK